MGLDIGPASALLFNEALEMQILFYGMDQWVFMKWIICKRKYKNFMQLHSFATTVVGGGDTAD